MTILICTATTIYDPSIDVVTSDLQARGKQVFRLNTDLFPTQCRINISFDLQDRILISSCGDVLDLSQISAVWIRPIDVGAELPDSLEPNEREASRLESESTIWSLLECLDAFQLDPLNSMNLAAFKPRQLQMAKSLGLEIPRTLITNDRDKVLDFAKTCRHGVISKMVDGSSIYVESGREWSSVYTSSLSVEDPRSLDGLELCPMIFQERVLKKVELRITVVGSSMFVAGIDSSNSPVGSDDWRKDKQLVHGFRPVRKFPKGVQNRLFDLLDRLHLNFATIDMIVTPDDRYIFLELNTVSYYYFIEDATNFPISSTIADLLIGTVPSRIVELR